MENSPRRLFVGPFIAPPQRADRWSRPIGTSSFQSYQTSLNPQNKLGASFHMNRMSQGAEFLGNVYNAIPEGIKSEINSQVKTKVENIVKNVGSGENSNGTTTTSSSGYCLSDAPDPARTELDSGIWPNTYVSEILDAKENECSPLHMTCVRLQFPITAGHKLQTYFTRMIAFDLQTKAQANVGFSLDIGNTFSDTKILNAMNSVLNALQVYFYYRSILSYHSYFENKNEGMNYLRRSITAQMLEDLSSLERRLLDTPCPPNLLELTRYLSNNYYSGDSQGSPMIKICPHAPTDYMTDSSWIATTLNDLAQANNNSVYTLMRRAMPQWKIGILKDVNPIPTFDKNFLTIFSNLPNVLKIDATTTVYQPNASASNVPVQYNSFTNTLDGVAYSLTAIRVGLDWLPSLIAPMTSGIFTNNRRSFYKFGTQEAAFYDVSTTPFLNRARPETNQLKDDGLSFLNLHLPGADKCQQVTADTIRETTYKVIDYLMSLETIPNSSVRGSLSGKSSSSRKPKRGNKSRKGSK